MSYTPFGYQSSGGGRSIDSLQSVDNQDGIITFVINYSDGTSQNAQHSLMSDALVNLEKVQLSGTNFSDKLIVKNASDQTAFQVNTLTDTVNMSKASITGAADQYKLKVGTNFDTIFRVNTANAITEVNGALQVRHGDQEPDDAILKVNSTNVLITPKKVIVDYEPVYDPLIFDIKNTNHTYNVLNVNSNGNTITQGSFRVKLPIIKESMFTADPVNRLIKIEPIKPSDDDPTEDVTFQINSTTKVDPVLTVNTNGTTNIRSHLNVIRPEGDLFTPPSTLLNVDITTNNITVAGVDTTSKFNVKADDNTVLFNVNSTSKQISSIGGVGSTSATDKHVMLYDTTNGNFLRSSLAGLPTTIVSGTAVGGTGGNDFNIGSTKADTGFTLDMPNTGLIWYRMGSMVWMSFKIKWTAKSGTGTDLVYIWLPTSGDFPTPTANQHPMIPGYIEGLTTTYTNAHTTTDGLSIRMYGDGSIISRAVCLSSGTSAFLTFSGTYLTES